MSRTLVVGPGRAGRSIALAQSRVGDAVQLLGRGGGDWMDWAVEQGLEPCPDLATAVGEDRLHNAATVILAVPDRALARVAEAVAGALPARKRRFVSHLSGFHDLGPLGCFAAQGHAVAALHPLLPFGEPHRDLLALLDARVTVLATSGSERAAGKLVRGWGARPIAFEDSLDRRRYHLGLSLAANHLTALLDWSERLLEPALGGEARPAACDLAQHALDALRAGGAAQALTGPVVRGDAEIIAAHLRCLDPPGRERYRALLEPLIALAARSGRTGEEELRRLRALLERPSSRPDGGRARA